MSATRWDAEKIELMEIAASWKRRAEVAEAKYDALMVRQDEMARQIEELRSESVPFEGGVS